MCLEVKKQKKKNDLFNCMLKCSKQYTHEVFIRGWNKKGKHRLMCLKILKDQERWRVVDFLR